MSSIKKSNNTEKQPKKDILKDFTEGFIKDLKNLQPKTSEEVIGEEKEYLIKRRKQLFGQDDTKRLDETKFGIAFSGGGIRSASICLGVVKKLHENKILEKADYISSVSGGGYANAYVQATLYDSEKGEKLVSDDFIGKMKEGGADYMSARSTIIPAEIIPAKLVSLLNILGTILIGLINPIILISSIILTYFIAYSFLNEIILFEYFNLSTYTLEIVSTLKFLTLLFIGGMTGYYFFGSTLTLRRFQLINIIIIYLVGILLIALALNHSSDFFQYIKSWINDFKNALSNGMEYIKSLGLGTGRAWSVLICFGLFFFILPQVIKIVRWIIRPFSGKTITTKPSNNKELRHLVYNTIIVLTIILLIIIVFGDSGKLANEWFALRLLGLIVLLGCFTNINLISIGRIYGDSLSKAFNIDKSITLRDLHKDDDKTKAPYPLFNCCLNLAPQSGKPNLTSDYFLLTPKHTGSESTDYVESDDITLSRAMTTSAAAVNTGMGVFSRGITSVLIGLFNFRMGALLSNPKNNNLVKNTLINRLESKEYSIRTLLKAFLYMFAHHIYLKVTWWPYYYIISSFSNNSKKDSLLDISDGGHIENLAVYELLKRECKLIIGIDAGMDAKYEFEDLKNLMKRAKSKLGIEIRFQGEDDKNNPFKIIKPNEYGLSTQQYAIADLIKKDKNGAETCFGKYVYVKSSLIENLSQLDDTVDGSIEDQIYNYRKFNGDFPHHSTTDQSFEPIQFMAYFDLGKSLCEKIIEDEVILKHLRLWDTKSKVQNG